MGVRNFIKKAIELLEANLYDVNDYRRPLNKKWIYDDFPRFDVNSTPRIGIAPITSRLENLSIGTLNRKRTHQIGIMIMLNAKDKFILPGDTDPSIAEDVLEYYQNQIEAILKDNFSDFKSEGYIIEAPTMVNYIQDENKIARMIEYDVMEVD